MTNSKKMALVLACSTAFGFGGISFVSRCDAAQAPQTQAASSGSRTMGTVKAIAGNAVTLTTDAGTEVMITVPEGARILRTAPGQKDLAGAIAIQVQDIQAGDRVLAKGKPSDDGKSVVVSSVLVMRKSDIEDKQAREREDWQKRGVAGRVTAIDPVAGTITVATSGFGGNKILTIKTSKSTMVRRYAPDSVRFDDAKLSAMEQIKAGDQLRARGNTNSEDASLAAEEIVAGTFRNIAGTVVSTDAANNKLTVMDLATKKPVVVKITGASQLRRLPPMMAQGIAMRLKGGTPQAGAQPGAEGGGRVAAGANGAGPRNGGGHGDFNQVLSRLPVITVADLQKGDAVMIVATQGNEAETTAITMLAGVEPILTASPKGGEMILSPWNLSGGPADAGAQ